MFLYNKTTTANIIYRKHNHWLDYVCLFVFNEALHLLPAADSSQGGWGGWWAHDVPNGHTRDPWLLSTVPSVCHIYNLCEPFLY